MDDLLGCPVCGSYEPGEEGWDWSMGTYGICEDCYMEIEEGDEFEDCDAYEDDDLSRDDDIFEATYEPVTE